MYKLFITIILIMFQSLLIAQDRPKTNDSITGDWHGQMEVMGTKLRVSFHITEVQGKYSATMDSPDQGGFDIKTTQTLFNNNLLEITLENLGVEFKGLFQDNTINGTFNQSGMAIPLRLNRKDIAKEVQKVRPQDPIKPYAYISEDIYFNNIKANNIKLAGTLTLPNNTNNPPVVILISGSGPQNRNEEVMAFNHRPFLVWSDYLTKKGIAVLRFDDRGVAESEGSQENATSADYATDVEAAVNYLKTRKDIDKSKIGLMGHSEGGFIAPMVASTNKDIAFIVLLAGTGVDGAMVLTTQTRKAGELAGTSIEKLNYNDKLSAKVFATIKKVTDSTKLKSQLLTVFHQAKSIGPEEFTQELTDETINNQINVLISPWFGYFIRTDPDVFLSKVECPVLAINGEKDFQVIADLNLKGIKKSLIKANNKDISIEKVEGLNHLFQTAQTGALDEYKMIEETISPIALNLVGNWINNRFGVKQK